MILFITGTPGTGKSTTARMMAEKLSIPLIELNQLVEDEGLYTGYHPQRRYKIVDLDALCQHLNEIIRKSIKDKEDQEGLIVVEGHLSHYCQGADVVIVLRTHPAVLGQRLEERGYKNAKIKENIEAEALDVCAFEAFQNYGDRVNEIDTTGKNPHEVVDIMVKIINGEEHFPVGGIDFLDYLCQNRDENF